MSNKKIHNQESGYIAERKNHISGGKIVIYIAKDQGVDVGSNKYAVICDKHSTMCGTTNLPDARSLMKYPEFCEQCMKIEQRQQ